MNAHCLNFDDEYVLTVMGIVYMYKAWINDPSIYSGYMLNDIICMIT